MKNAAKVPTRNYDKMNADKAESLGYYDGSLCNIPKHTEFKDEAKRRAYVRGYRAATR